jgi:hypothetical protein
VTNKKNIFYQDLFNLFTKGNILLEKKFIEKVKRLGDLRYFSLGGFFVEDDRADTDIFIVGDFDKGKVLNALKIFEKEINKDINYTVMDENEYALRKDIADGFLENIIDNEKNLVIVDKINKKL